MIFADARRPNEQAEPEIRDISYRDFHTIVRYMESRDCICVAKPSRYPGKVISGLRINDLATELNKALGIVSLFDKTHVPLEPSCSPGYVIAMALQLGLRWYVFFDHNHFTLKISN